MHPALINPIVNEFIVQLCQWVLFPVSSIRGSYGPAHDLESKLDLSMFTANKSFRVVLISRINQNATNHFGCKNFLLGQMARFRGEVARFERSRLPKRMTKAIRYDLSPIAGWVRRCKIWS